MSKWGSAIDIDADSLYKASYGDIPDEMVIDDGMNNLQVSRVGDDFIMKDESFTKAVNVGAASAAAGYAFTPIVWDQDVIDITRKMTPLLKLIPKVTNKGKAAYYYRITERGVAAWGGEDPALNESDDTGAESHESIKYLRVPGRVTGVAQIAGSHFESSMQRQVINKTQTINEAIEEEILVGTNTATHGHDGLQQLLSSNSSDLSAAISLSDVEDLVDDCLDDKGAPNLLITDFHTVTALKRQMMDYVKYVPTVELAWGLKTVAINTSVGDIPIIGSQFMPTTTGSRRIFCVNTNYLQQRVLQDITFERLAKTSDSEKFMLKTYRTFINKFPEGMGQIYGIDA
jgi:hypothetical protein